MDKMRWKLIEAIFNQAIALPDGEQLTLIEQRCGDDTALLQEVKTLLAQQNSATKIHNVIAKTAANFVTLQENLIGKTIGNYRVLQSLARGGMGSVFLAERADDQYQQQVAIKLIQTRLGDNYTKQAFKAERQILANLEHANIARLLDGGTLENNMPYLVMEYVKGQSINRYCSKKNLSLKARLILFNNVCNVVQFAHQNLIIHCDLKPSNILITASGEVKLLDFGISKLIVQPGDNDKSPLQTQAYSLAYSSPEQLQLQPVSVMADVYALGVVLFEILTQQKPFDLCNKNISESKALILNTQPLLASLALNNSLISHAKQQITASQLTGDIDAIINKALQKSPQLRYQSATQLSDDINSFLNNQLVNARESPWSLKLMKLFKRNITFSVASLVVASAIISFSSMLWLQSIQLKKERDRSEITLSFFTDMFNELDPDNEKGQNVLVREVLDRTSEALTVGEHPLKRYPYSEAIIRNVMGNIYLELGLLSPAEQHLTSAMQLFQREELINSPAYLSLLLNISQLHGVKFERIDALAIINESLTLSKKINGDNAPVTLGIMSNLAAHLNMQGDHYAAKALYDEVYLKRLTTMGEEHIDTINTLRSIGIVYHWLGQFEKAHEYYLNTHRLLVKIKGQNHPSSFSVLSLIGSVLQAMEQYQRADTVITSHIQIATAVLGENHPEVLRSRHNLADVYKGLGQFEIAENLFREVLAKRQRHLGAAHIETLQTQKKLARLLNEIGGDNNRQEALTLASNTVEIKTEKLGETHPDTVSTLQTLADIYFSQKVFNKAKALYLKILTIRNNSIEYQNHPHSITIYLNLAAIEIQDNKIMEAEIRFNQAVAISKQHANLYQQKIKATALQFIKHLQDNTNDSNKTHAFQIYL